MGRTRGASAVFPQIDRQGNPVSPAASMLHRAPPINSIENVPGPGMAPVVELPPVTSYRFEVENMPRNIEAFELGRLLDLLLKKPDRIREGFAIELTPEEFTALSGDLRRHFRPIRG